MFRQRLSKVWKNKNKFIDDGPRSAEWCFQKWSCSSSHGWISTFSCFTSPSWQNAWSMNFGLVSSWPCPHSGYLTLGRHLKPRQCHFHKPLDIHLFPTVFDKKIKRLIVFFFILLILLGISWFTGRSSEYLVSAIKWLGTEDACCQRKIFTQLCFIHRS